jgi:predicted HTH transcriptional regulator
VFLLRALQQQKRALERKIERESTLLGDLPELSARILELARERGRVTIAEAVKATGASRNTIKDHVRALTDRQHLTRHGAGRGAWYAPNWVANHALCRHVSTRRRGSGREAPSRGVIWRVRV